MKLKRKKLKLNSIILISILFFIYSCNSAVEKDKRILKNVSIKSDATGSIEELFNCDDENFDATKKSLLDSINKIQKEIIDYASSSKLDSEKIIGLINAVKENGALFDNSFTKESDLIFWSYGSSSMRGERLVSTNCYYLVLLKRQLELLLYVKRKVQTSYFP